MKKRHGFVSNSSSASFVLLGFSVGDVNTEDFWHRGWDYIYEGEGGAPNGEGIVVGKYLLYVRDEDYPFANVFDIDPIMKEVKAMREELGADTPIRIYTEVKSC